MNGEEIVHSQPLPSEFLRDRKPYRHVPPEERQQNTMPQQQEAAQQEPSQSTPNNIPRRSHQSQERNYRVDNLPESLWDEALTVAAQTYTHFLKSISRENSCNTLYCCIGTMRQKLL